MDARNWTSEGTPTDKGDDAPEGQGCEGEGQVGEGQESAETSAPCRPYSPHWGTGAGTDRDTVNMLARAARERWPIPQDLREDACRILGEIIRNSPDSRAIAVACRTLGVYDGLNLQQEKRDTGEDRVRAVVHLTGEDIRLAAAHIAQQQLTSTGQGASQ